MKRCLKIVIVLFILVLILNTSNSLSYGASKESNYEKDYLAKVFTSENGLEGTVANCVFSSDDGFLWIGGYTGLYRYDGTEFKRLLINERALPINTITQDIQGNLWIGTNGDGIYRYDGTDFVEYHLGADENGAYIINRLYSDSKGVLWIGTKAGLFSIDIRKENAQTKENETLKNAVIQDISQVDTGEIVIVEKTGNVFLIKANQTKEITITGAKIDGVPRCCNAGTGQNFYIGTTENKILKVSVSGKVKAVIDGTSLTSFNDIKEIENGEFWVCSDSGIGILKNDVV